MLKYFLDRKQRRLSAYRERKGWYGGEWWTIIENFTCKDCKARPGGHLTLEGACEKHAGIMTVVSMDPDKFLKQRTYKSYAGVYSSWGYSGKKKLTWDEKARADAEKKVTTKTKRYNTTKFDPVVAPLKAAIRKAERERDKFIQQAYDDLPEVTILDHKPKTRKKK